ncbi:tetratricopeptide repeat protein [Cronbergia sp. UHCC 0137]|uniref:CHAT domain-containing protein n=1 Tax=Cronbergia sp. UHCC 0137 TaxID=3110239 RepID=UPI002B1FB564|nr:tetratricopeptide repeat protein [Cronbergia sp. UHCC 0137]MEA5619272.1 tetratricopeptide repeat protein [Cronbergia sp. UHCC 0137]
MFRWLLQWLNTVFKYPFGNRQDNNLMTNNDKEVDPNSLPELTNGDLELLFTQLLEGVHQARGQQWALKYLQRMEPRITVDRWLDWLLIFGERLLISPVPNHYLGQRMVQLGQLDIGKVGELSYEIGIQLLTRDLEDEKDQQPVEESLLQTPGQKLLAELGENIWQYDEKVANINSVVSVDEYSNNQTVETEYFNYSVVPVAETWKEFSPDLSDGYSEHQSENQYDYLREAVGEDVVLVDDQTQPLVNVEPQIAHTLEELVVRLEHNTNLVQQLSAELAIRSGSSVSFAGNSALSVADRAQELFYQGLEQAKAGNLSGALVCYEQAIQWQPTAYLYWFNKGLTLFYLQRFEEAIAAYNQTITLKPNFYQAWFNRGRILGELGEFEEAIACFDKVTEIKPNYPECWSNRGAAQLKLGLVWEAIFSYDQALSLEPQDQENWYYRGIALGISEQYDEAIAAYDQALKIQPDYHEVWIDRGVVLFNLRRWLEAIESWDQALSVQPDLYLAWFNRGVALDNLGRLEDAIFSYQQAIAINPDFHLAWYNQAVALFYLERYAEAIASYDNALQIKLDYWEAWIGRGTAASNLVITGDSLRLFSSIAATNPALSLGGYEGKLASYQEGLKYLRPDTHPEGWGRLHLAIGNTHYEYSKKQPTPQNYWYEAITEYQQALLTLTATDFPELHLEILQSFSKLVIALEQIAPAKELQKQSTNLLQELLNQPNRLEESKKQLSLKFAGIEQLNVDLAVNNGDLVEAWEIAEQGKNACLNWLLFGESRTISTKYHSIQRLLNPTTAIVYWHISPIALHTFIIKDQAPSPIPLFTPIQDVAVIPEAVQRLIAFENWLEDWHQQQEEYRHQAQETQKKHPWRVEIEQKLSQLKDILNISTIIQELEGITNLILIPHRDLYRVPIHALFHFSSPEQTYTISYLPSIQMGFSLKSKAISNWQQQKLLIVEHPNSSNSPSLKSIQFESDVIAQMFGNFLRVPGKKATKEQVNKLLLTDYNIFHFMGDVINNLSSPLKSELALLSEDHLTLAEICQKTLVSYKLVTLANCQTNNTNKHKITSEYIGLDTSFLSAGVPHVVSTIWNVESSASSLVMIEFYRRLQSHKSPALALAEATTWLRQITAGELTKWYENLLHHVHPEDFKVRTYLATELYRASKISPEKRCYSHPYYWAAFIILGCG